MYWLQTRFYDATTGRFISPDDTQYLDTETIHGVNLYTYCNDCPTMFADPTGHAPKWLQIAGWVGLALGLVLCATAIVILAAGVSASTLLGAIAVGAAKGALIGGAIGAGMGAISGGISSAIAGNSISSGAFWSDVAFGAMVGFGIGALTGAISGGLSAENSWYYSKALEFTNNGSEFVYLGKNPTYYQIGENMGGAYFHVSDAVWNETAQMPLVNMWKINKAFLKQQIALNHSFVFTSADFSGLYAKEVEFIAKHAYISLF